MKSWRSRLSLVLGVTILSLSIAAQVRGYAGGSGAAEDPYRIADVNELACVGSTPADQDKHFVLVADIDLAGTVWSGAVIPRFSGTFDGNGRRIRNLSIRSTTTWIGLFGEIVYGAHVRNLGIVDVNVAGSSILVGGLAGINNGTVSSCYSTGSVAGHGDVGGLVGRNDSGSVSNCYSSGWVSGNGSVGGLVGGNYGNGSITNCYGSSVVIRKGHNVGGLVGYSRNDITNSFWDMERSGLAPNDDGSGRTTVEMQDPNTFLDAGWDLVGETRNGTSEIWMMPAGGGYPVPSIFHGYRPPSLNGRGTTADPYLIASAAELGVVAWHNRTACFRLAANIDLAGIQWSTAVIPVFSGVFDANDLVIANLTIVGGDYLGLFGTLEPGGQVRNMGIVDVNVISSGKYAGGLAGRNHGTASDCYTTGTVAARSYAGGLVGCNEGLVTECYSTSSVAGGFAGGLVGCQSGRVIKSHSTGAVAGRVNVGGLVGVNYPDSVIEDCYSTGKVEGEVYIGGLLGCGSLDYVTRSYSTGAVAGLSKVGGLVGLCGGLIENCYSRSIVSGESCVGGLVGDSTFGSIVRCYSTGPVSGTVSCGGLLGYDYFSSPSVVDSFWDIETSGCATSEGGTGLTMGQMRQRASFAAWDFEHVWTICEDRDYPRLQWEGVDCYE